MYTDGQAHVLLSSNINIESSVKLQDDAAISSFKLRNMKF